ncbi:MAG: hypothetical protein ACRDRH_06265 [Pseudonocardia sp.]
MSPPSASAARPASARSSRCPAAAAQAHGEHFGEVRPASTMLLVAGLLDPRWLVEVELDEVLDVR